MKPKRLILAGAGFLLAGWFVLLLMVIGVLPNGLMTSLIAYAGTVFGTGLGLMGVLQYRRF